MHYPMIHFSESRARDSFTQSDLDEIAPLVPGDEKWLGERCIPSYETLRRLEQRIKAAQILKYGTPDET